MSKKGLFPNNQEWAKKTKKKWLSAKGEKNIIGNKILKFKGTLPFVIKKRKKLKKRKNRKKKKEISKLDFVKTL